MPKPWMPIICAALVVACSQPDETTRTAEQTAAEQEAAAAQRAEAARLEQARLEAEQLAQQRAAYKSNIEAVLQKDAALSGRASEMRLIDTSGCPPEFRAAYLDHVYAWARKNKIDATLAQMASDEVVGLTVLASIIAGLSGSDATPIKDYSQAESELKELRSQASGEISSTFQKVERIAVMYGAVLPSAASA